MGSHDQIHPPNTLVGVIIQRFRSTMWRCLRGTLDHLHSDKSSGRDNYHSLLLGGWVTKDDPHSVFICETWQWPMPHGIPGVPNN